MGIQFPLLKKVQSPSTIFGPFLLWPNGWMHQDATWYEGRPQPRGLCATWGPSPLPKRGWSPQIFGPCLLWPNVKMDQDVLDVDQAPPSPKRWWSPSPIFGPFLLWPNGWMHQDATWYKGRPHPRGLCATWGRSSPPQKGAELPKSFARSLWSNSWMDQDGTWHGGGPWSRPHCARLGPSSPPKKKGQSPQFSAHVYCGQMAAWIKMPLGTEVGLGLRDIVLDGDPAPSPLKGHSRPIFSQCPLWLNGWMA